MNKKSTPFIKFVNGKGLNPNIEVLFYVLLALLIILGFTANGPEGLLIVPLLPIGLVPLFSGWGTEIQLSSKNYRHYRSIYGLSWGKWKSYTYCSDIVIQTNHYSGLAQSRTSVSTTVEDKRTEVFFMTFDHRHKVLIAVAENAKEAFEIAQDLSRKTGFPIKKFHPKSSFPSKRP